MLPTTDPVVGGTNEPELQAAVKNIAKAAGSSAASSSAPVGAEKATPATEQAKEQAANSGSVAKGAADTPTAATTIAAENAGTGEAGAKSVAQEALSAKDHDGAATSPKDIAVPKTTPLDGDAATAKAPDQKTVAGAGGETGEKNVVPNGDLPKKASASTGATEAPTVVPPMSSA